MKQVALVLAVLGACTGEGNQIIIELDGPVMATSVDLVFAEPHVFIKRDQRINQKLLDPSIEPAFYVIQRRRLDRILESDVRLPVDDVELQIVGADGLLPIAIARDIQGAIVGMGVLDPERVFRDDGASTESFTTNLQELADITRYPIVIEPVVESNSLGGPSRPVSIGSGEVHSLACANAESPSGLLWRPQPVTDGIQHQLRIALPLDGGDDALQRVETDGFDLDCDNHTPANRGMIPLGDEADCDDTSSLVSRDPSQREACDQIDNDCNENSVGATVSPAMCATCLGNKLTCLEGVDATNFDSGGCTEASRCLACAVHTQNVGSLIGCNSLGELPLPGECGAQCVIRVVGSDPRWEIKIGDPGEPELQIFEGYTPISSKLGFAVIPAAGPPTLQAADPNFGSFVLAYQPSENGKVVTIEVILVSEQSTTHTGVACAQPFEIMPACGPNG